jgi:hypothetical protein
MLQKFMDGKKKYSAFIITVLATMIPLFIQDPEAQKTIMDFVPSIAAALAGIFYIVTQGNIDKETEKTKTALATNGTATSTQNGIPALPASVQRETQPVTSLPLENIAVIPSLDLKLFHERVLNDVAVKYTEQNAATVFYTAREKGGLTTCHDIKQAQDYWDYLVTLAYDAEQYVREATNVDQPGPCKVRSPEHVQMQNELAKTVRLRDNVYVLAQTNIDWRTKLGGNDTLLHVGALAEELLKANR